MGVQNLAEEYLIKVGFQLNKTQFGEMAKFLGKTGDDVSSLTSKITKNTVTSVATISTVLVSLAMSTAKFLESIAQADMDIEKLAKRRWMSEESTRSLENALSVMGESFDTLNDIALNPELRGQFVELYSLTKRLSAPGELQAQLKMIRSIMFEFKKFNLIMQYVMQNVAYYLSKFLGDKFQSVKKTMEDFNDWLIKNIPQISEKIAKFLYVAIRLLETVGKVIYNIYNVIKNLLIKLPKDVKIFGAAIAAGGLIALKPFLAIIAALLFLILLLEDYYTYKAGGKSAFQGMWEGADDLTSQFGGLGPVFEKLTEAVVIFVAGFAGFKGMALLVDGVTAAFAGLLSPLGTAALIMSGILVTILALKEEMKIWDEITNKYGDGSIDTMDVNAFRKTKEGKALSMKPGGLEALAYMGANNNLQKANRGDSTTNKNFVINQKFDIKSTDPKETGRQVGSFTNRAISSQIVR